MNQYYKVNMFIKRVKTELSIDNIITYMIITLIFTELCLKGIKSNDVIEYENSKIFQELVKRPEQYVNNAIKYNLEYLEIKLNCVNYINETTKFGMPMSKKVITTIVDVKKIMKIIEKMLLGIMDILDVKLYLDEQMLNNSKHYNRLVITSEDIESYKELDATYSNIINIIQNNYNILRVICKQTKPTINNYVLRNDIKNANANYNENNLEELEYMELLEYITYLENNLKTDL